MITGKVSGTRIARFGTMPDGRAVHMHTLVNDNGMEVCFINLGGIIGAVKVPDRNGHIADLTPGYDYLQEYLADPHYFGALIGRYANRIADAHFVIDGVAYSPEPNDGPNLLHGGAHGFHRAIWDVEPFETDSSAGAVLKYSSPDGEGGFPGRLDAQVTYSLTDANELVFEYEATATRPTPVNLTQHFYLNLAGHGAGNILDHELMIAAQRYLPIDEESIPAGPFEPVASSPFDFRTPRLIGDALTSGDAMQREKGYDHTFVLDGASIAARVTEPTTGRTLEIETTEPGLQFYSGNYLPDGMKGKEGTYYGRHSALALETQHFPNSPNVATFPNTILRPGAVFRSRTVYRFGTIA
jgi:aldose 1-epimerase